MSPVEDLTREERKKIVKEAINEWLDCQFAKFGRWTVYGIVSLLLGALVYLFFVTNGWVRMP